MRKKIIKKQIFKLIIVCCLGLLIGFAMMRFIQWHIDTDPSSACDLLKKSFASNDTFSLKSCSLKEKNKHKAIVLVLNVKEEMEAYFDQDLEKINNENITDHQIDFYCSEFFDRTRVDELNLNIDGKAKKLQEIDLTRDICH